MTTPSLKELAREREELRFDRFDLDVAWRLGCLVREIAEADALPGTSSDNAEWIRRKRNTVMRFHRPSLALRLECEAKGTRWAHVSASTTGDSWPAAAAYRSPRERERDGFRLSIA